jgi:hypothetical protein
MLKAAVLLLAGRSTAAETTKKIMEDFEKLMNSGDPQQATELLKPEVRPSDSAPIVCSCSYSHLGCRVQGLNELASINTLPPSCLLGTLLGKLAYIYRRSTKEIPNIYLRVSKTKVPNQWEVLVLLVKVHA